MWEQMHPQKNQVPRWPAYLYYCICWYVTAQFQCWWRWCGGAEALIKAGLIAGTWSPPKSQVLFIPWLPHPCKGGLVLLSRSVLLAGSSFCCCGEERKKWTNPHPIYNKKRESSCIKKEKKCMVSWQEGEYACKVNSEKSVWDEPSV